MKKTYLYVILIPQMNEKRELGYMIKFGYTENFENRLRNGYNQYHNYVEILHLYEGNFTMDDETRIKQYFKEKDYVFVRDEYLKFIPEVLEFFDTYDTSEKLKELIMKLPKISKNGRYYKVNSLYIECILSKCYPNLQLVDKQNMRNKLYKELRCYVSKEQVIYIQSAYNISEESLLKYVEDNTTDLSQISDDVKLLVEEFCALRVSTDKLKYLVMISEKKLSEKDLINFLDLIPEKFRDYYIEMGPNRIKANSYQENKLKAEWNKRNLGDEEINTDLVNEILSVFIIGQRYTFSYIKSKLRELYQKYGYNKNAKAVDLKEYFQLKRAYVTSIKKNCFEIQKKR